METMVGGSGPTRMADQDVCVAVGQDLQRSYPDYPWMVGCNHEAGTIVIDLGVTKPVGTERYAYLLHIDTVLGPGGQQHVMRAGGEVLERFGLRRGSAQQDFRLAARENGLDTDAPVLKSRF